MIKYNQFGEVVSVNGITTGQHLGTPMQDAKAVKPEDNEVYAEERETVTKTTNMVDDVQPTPSGGGTADAVDWENVQNKPFEMVGSDTLTWDGNQNGLLVIDAEGEAFCKISDALPTSDDFKKGGILTKTTTFDKTELDELPFVYENIYTFEDGTIIIGGSVFIIPPDVASKYASQGVTIESGTYFVASKSALEEGQWVYTCSLTINGYTGFTKETIKQEVLPESLWFGESETGSDTLTWDGNSEGLYTVVVGGRECYHISDATPTLDDFANNGTFVLSIGATEELKPSDVSDVNGAIAICEAFGLVIPTDNFNFNGSVFEKKGIYFNIHQNDLYITSLTINGYNGFTTKTIKPIDVKYLPMDAIVEAVKASL